MAFQSVISRTRPMLMAAGRSDVTPAMAKWWKPRLVDDGQIVRSLSPYEQQIVMPWLKTFPKRAYDKFMGSGIWPFTTIAGLWGFSAWADATEAATDFGHRY